MGNAGGLVQRNIMVDEDKVYTHTEICSRLHIVTVKMVDTSPPLIARVFKPFPNDMTESLYTETYTLTI